jgi:hypothetical protein
MPTSERGGGEDDYQEWIKAMIRIKEVENFNRDMSKNGSGKRPKRR